MATGTGTAGTDTGTATMAGMGTRGTITMTPNVDLQNPCCKIFCSILLCLLRTTAPTDKETDEHPAGTPCYTWSLAVSRSDGLSYTSHTHTHTQTHWMLCSS